MAENRRTKNSPKSVSAERKAALCLQAEKCKKSAPAATPEAMIVPPLTARLRFREFELRDLPAVVEMRCDEETMQHLVSGPGAKTQADCEEWLRKLATRVPSIAAVTALPTHATDIRQRADSRTEPLSSVVPPAATAHPPKLVTCRQ